jgi:peptide/nickel transport system permease protein
MFVSYALVRLAPGDPTKSSIFGESPTAENMSSEKNALAQNTSMRKKLHLDDPVPVGFFFWLKDVLFYGDLGASASVDKGRPVTALIMERLPVTLSLNFWAVLITYVLSIPIGIYSALYPHSVSDRFMTFFLFLLYSLPVFWVALVLQATLCKGGCYPVFPLKGLEVADTWGLSSWEILWKTALHYTLPVFCLCYGSFAGLSRYARSGMLEVVNKEYIRTARAKGVSEIVVIFKHSLRNALIILITLFAGLIPGLVAGSIFVEYVFNIPGMGELSMSALSSRDIPLLMALFAFGGILTLGGILLADFMYVLADPRISFERRR